LWQTSPSRAQCKKSRFSSSDEEAIRVSSILREVFAMSHLGWFVLSVVAALLVACADTPDREPSGQGGNGGSGGIAGAGGEGGAGGSGGDGGGGSAGIGGSGGTGEGGAGGEGGTGGDGGDEFE